MLLFDKSQSTARELIFSSTYSFMFQRCPPSLRRDFKSLRTLHYSFRGRRGMESRTTSSGIATSKWHKIEPLYF